MPRAEVIHGDCFDVLAILAGRRVDAVVTDPPYGIGASTMTLGSGVKDFKRGGAWDEERVDLQPFLALAPHACIWGGNYYTDILPPTDRWLIWHKLNDGLSFSEAEMAWTTYSARVRVLQHHWGGEKKCHPTQKPLPVMRWCVALLPDECRVVLDPFAGVGTTGVACVLDGRDFIGIERDAGYVTIARRRIEDALAQPRLSTVTSTTLVVDQGQLL